MTAIVKRLGALGAVAVAVLIAAAPASARIVEVGFVEPAAAASCPSPCMAITRTTGYQIKVGTTERVMRIPENGRIVAWTISLGTPSARQKQFFDRGFGGTASAGISVLRTQRRPKRTATVVGQSPIVQLEDYFGQTVQFPLEQSIRVRKDQLVGLTVPTWAPALAVGQAQDNAWRASRPNQPRSGCFDNETQTAQTTMGRAATYRCLYRTARLTYSATLITDPVPTAPPETGAEAQPGA